MTGLSEISKLSISLEVFICFYAKNRLEPRNTSKQLDMNGREGGTVI